MTTTVLSIKSSEVENKIPDLPKYITIVKFNKFTKGNFTARLKQADLVTKADFDNKLTCSNRKIITSNEIKHLEVQKKINTLKKNDNLFQTTRFNHTMIFFKLTDI